MKQGGESTLLHLPSTPPCLMKGAHLTQRVAMGRTSNNLARRYFSYDPEETVSTCKVANCRTKIKVSLPVMDVLNYLQPTTGIAI